MNKINNLLEETNSILEDILNEPDLILTSIEESNINLDDCIIKEEYIRDTRYYIISDKSSINEIDINNIRISPDLNMAVSKYLDSKENYTEVLDRYIAYSYSYNILDKNLEYISKIAINSKTSYMYIDNENLNETIINKKNAYPIYIITSFTFTSLGKIITKFTNSNFSHASISLNSDLNEMYSFNANYKNLLDNGLVKENIKNFKKSNPNSIMQVSILFVKKDTIDKLSDILNDMISNKEKYHYHFLGLISVLFNINKINDFKMICSEFVARILSLLNIDISDDKSMNLISPKDISLLQFKNNKIYTVFNGYINDYKPIYIDLLNSKIDNYEYIKESSNDINISRKFKDIKNIVDSLSDEELYYIGNGEFVDSPNTKYRLVYLVNNDPAGFIDVYKQINTEYHFIEIAIKKKYRRKGLAESLVKRMLLEYHGRPLMWSCKKNNKASIALANKLKFMLNNNKSDNYEYVLEETIIDISSISILETKEFPVDFDKDGNLIIQNYKKLDFEAEYSKAHKLLMSYAKYSNLEGIKYELSKLWFMNIVLEKRIYSSPTENELIEYNKVRSRILNDFNKYLDFVLNKERNFNFTEYYNNSPFSDVNIKISGTLLSGIANLVKQLL